MNAYVRWLSLLGLKIEGNLCQIFLLKLSPKSHTNKLLVISGKKQESRFYAGSTSVKVLYGWRD